MSQHVDARDSLGCHTPTEQSVEPGTGSLRRNGHQDVASSSKDEDSSLQTSTIDIEKQPTQAETAEDVPPLKDPNLIEWDSPTDPQNPMNFSQRRRWIITASLGAMTFSITFASSVFSQATSVTATLFSVSDEVMILGTSLFVLGFAIGPLIWGPASELYGRKTPLFIGFFLFALFTIPVAVAQDVETIMVCRFFGGVFGSAPLGIGGGILADMWDPVNRGYATVIFSGTTFLGPITGPIAGGFITMSSLTWRWTQYLTAILAFTTGLLGLIVIPETYGPILLQRHAKSLRHSTKIWAIRSKKDEEEVDIKLMLKKYLFRPFAMLALEPILLLFTLYMSLIYGIIYLFFFSYPITFIHQRGWSLGIGALPFLSLAVGMILGILLILYTSKTRFEPALLKTGRVVPEERLIPMIVGGGVFPVGLFWYAWTSDPDMSWVPQVVAGVPIGMGLLTIFMQGLTYLIDVYTVNANSAISANSFVRSFLGAGFPLFANAMYQKLGVAWATSLLGFLALAMFPIPILFFIYGKKIRSLSRYSITKCPHLG
ncbi:MFS general substrate transporter [Tothia fuscella]|uniref:MFS general substrate transporter n=1 Tax=Tothia fuscella TaxID=1048955 RepID=A0A9P4NLS6_9PEZI|nr:MFS general substrate transporter [Tothia fuscella]